VLFVRHRTSRALDPQLHTHAVVGAKVKSVDGRWRALDATMLYRDQRVLGALYQAALRAELTARLGVGWGPVVRGQAEIAGVDRGLLEVFSKRARQVARVLERRVAGFVEEHGREPSRREWAILSRDAAKDSRPRKERGRPPDSLRREWLRTAAAHGYGAAVVLERMRASGERQRRGWALTARQSTPMGACDLGRLAEEVIAVLTAEGSVWTLADVQREVAARLPTGGGGTAREQVRRVEAAAARVVSERCVDLAPADARGVARDVLSDPGVQRYTTRKLFEQEHRIVRMFREAAAAGGGPVAIGERLARGLDAEQAAAAGLVAGTGTLVVVIGPAGAGKTKAMSAAVKALRTQGRVVLGLAPWAVAAEQLTRETGLHAETVERFLTEHELRDGPSSALNPPAGATVIVDEAGLLRTDDMERLMDLAQRRGYRLALVGDSRQLAAVGRSGMFDHARAIAPTVRLEEIRRFRDRWEADASRALRDCDPAALDAYEQHSRIRAGTAREIERAVLEDWWQAMQRGRSTAFTAPTNEQVQRLNKLARRRLVDVGRVADDRVIVTTLGQRVGAGDEIQTRLNDREQSTDLGQWVRNRQRWIVEHVHDDGRLRVRGRNGGITLDADYCREHVELAYFTTVHSAQGLTREVGGTIVEQLSGWRSVYVGLTRGRERNTAYVVLNTEDDARAVLERALRRDRADLGALRIQRQLADDARIVMERRQRELTDEQVRLRAQGQSAAGDRLAQVETELEQLEPPRAPPPVRRKPRRSFAAKGPRIGW